MFVGQPLEETAEDQTSEPVLGNSKELLTAKDKKEKEKELEKNIEEIKGKIARRVDKVCLFFIPSLFVAFNFYYWIRYMIVQNHKPSKVWTWSLGESD